jgi:hypothetical protein
MLAEMRKTKENERQEVTNILGDVTKVRGNNGREYPPNELADR